MNRPIAALAKERGLALKDEAYEFRTGIAVELAEGDSDKGVFKMLALTGKPFAHPFWDNFAVDLSTLSFKDDQRIPVLREHARDQVVGFTSKIDVGQRKGVTVEGQFSEVTPDAKEVRELASEGFPWEASLRVPPGEIEFLNAGESTKVNGQKLEGPGTIFRNARIEEVSFVCLGADPGTKVETFSSATEDERERAILNRFTFSTKESAMSNQTATNDPAAPVAVETPPVDEAKVRDEAVASERKRISELKRLAFSGQEELLSKAIDDGTTVEDAAKLFIEEQKATNSKRLEELKKDDIPETGPNLPKDKEAGASENKDELAADFDPDKEPFDEAKFSKFWEEKASDELKTEFRNDKDVFLANYKNHANNPQRRTFF